MTPSVHELVKAKVSAPPPVWPAGMSGDISDLLDRPAPAVQWFAERALLANRAQLLTGVGGSSKTRILYYMAIGGIIGRVPWGWSIVRRGTAALFLCEDTLENVHRSLRAILEFGDYTAAERQLVGERLKIFPLAGHDARLLANVGGGVLLETDAAAGLMRRCKDIPDLVFIGLDPALALTEGDEMNPAHQRRLGEWVDRLAIETNAAVVLTSHAAKALQNADELGSHSSRGSGAITDAVRGEFTCRTMTADEGRKFGIRDIDARRAYVQLAATKGNELPPSAFGPIWLKRCHGGALELADLAAPVSDPIGPREKAAFAILQRLASGSTPMMRAWRDECAAEGLLTGANPGAQKKAMDRIREALVFAGMVKPGYANGSYLPVEGLP